MGRSLFPLGERGKAQEASPARDRPLAAVRERGKGLSAVPERGNPSVPRSPSIPAEIRVEYPPSALTDRGKRSGQEKEGGAKFANKTA